MSRRFKVRWRGLAGPLLWLGVVATTLVGLDVLQRFLFYEVRDRDRGSLRIARRPAKDVILAGLHALPSDIARLEARYPVFDIYLEPDDERRLREGITRVQKIGTHDPTTRSWIEARLTVEGKEYDAEIKLRGRQYYHVIPPRPSLRVKLERGASWNECRVFNLVDPFDKTTDQVFANESRRRGLIAWEGEMGLLAFRGKTVGAVHFVEQIRRATGDHARRPEGMFFRGTGEHYSEGADPVRCAPVVKRVCEWLADSTATIDFSEFQQLVDVERARWFTALTELSGDSHGLANFNMKGYCDPVTMRAEFLIWDTRFGDWTKLPTSQFAEQGTQLLRCDEFRFEHDKALYELVTTRVPSMIADYESFMKDHGDLLASDPLHAFPRGGPDGGFLRDRPAKFRKTMTANAEAIQRALEGEHLAWYLDAERGEILVTTDDRGSKRIRGIRFVDGQEHTFEESRIVYGSYREHRPVVAVPISAAWTSGEISGLVAENVHTGAPIEALRQDVRPVGPVRHLADPDTPWPLFPRGFEVDPQQGLVRVGPGHVEVTGLVATPPGIAVEIVPGTTLAMGPDALLEVHGDLRAVGHEEAPIVVRGADHASSDWGAVAVFGRSERPPRVDLAHIHFDGGRGSNIGTAKYTASFAAYVADVTMDHVRFHGGAAEDAINLKYCSVDAQHCSYRNGAGDAVDYDFCDGSDRYTVIKGYGDDGLDLSGSTVHIDAARIESVGDKAFSIGEGSTITVVAPRIADANTGLAVKDSSQAEIFKPTVVRANTGLALYRKKPSFGPPQATISGWIAVDVLGLAILDHGAQANLENAIRVVEPGLRVRPFHGVAAHEIEGISELAPEELLALADELRRASPGSAKPLAQPREALDLGEERGYVESSTLKAQED